jgi:NTP pyrophosphatase (non-canonical NTP hydrolase)
MNRMTDEQKEKCHNIAEHYGEEHQMLKAVEEMAELTQAIMKYLDNPAEWDSLIDELADVNIMIEQLNHIVSKRNEPGYDALLDMYHRITMKLNRQLERMERENNG